MHITIIQPLYPEPEDPIESRDCIHWMRELLKSLRKGDHDLILLPEYANAPGLGTKKAAMELVEGEGASLLREVAAQAKRLECLLIVGALITESDGCLNRTLLFDRKGELATHYDKIHLTAAEASALGLSAGIAPVVHTDRAIRIGFATCFDLYFSEHFESLAVQRPDVIACPSYQRSESPDRIRLIAQARALDTGSYLIRSSYATGDSSRGGHSLVAAPSGEILLDLGSEAGLGTIELDLSEKFIRAASHGQPLCEHRGLIEKHRQPATYRKDADGDLRMREAPFPHLSAHRGLSIACPENTLPAFAAASALGVHEIELDLRPSRDGVAVVCHDETVDRTTDGFGRIRDLDWKSIRALDAGRKTGDDWKGVRIPRFEEILDWLPFGLGVNIHIKDSGEDGSLIRKVCEMLLKQDLCSSVYLALDTLKDLNFAQQVAPDLTRACLVRQDDPDKSIRIAIESGCGRIQFGRGASADQIRMARENGLVCNLFFSDDPVDGKSYVEKGIDVVLTNRANQMIAGGFQSAQMV